MEKRPDLHVITELRQIKALADPLRQRILGAFVIEPRTTKQVATLLGQPPTKLYHHVDLLERAGLIRLVDTRPKRGTTEKYFQAIANRFSIGQDSLGTEGGSVVESAFAKAFAEAQEEIHKSVASGAISPDGGAECAFMALGTLRLAPEDLPLIQERLAGIASDLPKRASDRSTYRLLAAIYPAPEEGIKAE